jgi:pyruvate dehydrogenase E2 component (dihydrolipoamide acetyltransferase)
MTRLRALTMPKWGIEMTEGNLAAWKVRNGDQVSKGQIVAVVETEKIANDIECEYDAVVARIVTPEGEIYPVGTLLAVLAEGATTGPEVEEFIKQFGAHAPAGASAAPATAVRRAAGEPAQAAAQEWAEATIPPDVAISPAARRLASQRAVDVSRIRGSGPGSRITYQDVDQASKPEAHRAPAAAVSIATTTAHLEGVFASPYAKRLAVRHSVDLTGLTGTGARGRISRQDVIHATGTAPAVAGDVTGGEPRQQPQIVHMTPMRKAIARQLTLSKSTIPHFYLRATVRVDALLALRARAKQEQAAQSATTNDYFLRAAALALRQVPDVNVHVHQHTIHRFAHADIAFAVATDKGLVAPIIPNADSKPLAVIAKESRLLAERARGGKLRPADLEGGTFTVSNLGMFGIDQFDAIINPPQGAILAIGAARPQMVPGAQTCEQATAVSLSLSCDHRAIDGAVGARFLSALRVLIEDPERL